MMTRTAAASVALVFVVSGCGRSAPGFDSIGSDSTSGATTTSGGDTQATADSGTADDSAGTASADTGDPTVTSSASASDSTDPTATWGDGDGSAEGPTADGTAEGIPEGSADGWGDGDGDGPSTTAATWGDGDTGWGDGDGDSDAGTSISTSTSTGDGDGDGDGDGEPCAPGIAGTCAGEKCSAYLAMPPACCVDTNACVPVLGDQRLGDPCTRDETNDDCADTLFCMPDVPSPSSGSTGPGHCRQMCDAGDPTSCAAAGQPDASCVEFNGGVLPLCDDSCSPLTPSCSAGLGCYYAGYEWLCMQPGPAQLGDACGSISECAAGLACTTAAKLSGCPGGRCCTSICDTSMSPDPCSTPGEACVAFYAGSTAPPGLANAGRCVLTP